MDGLIDARRFRSLHSPREQSRNTEKGLGRVAGSQRRSWRAAIGMRRATMPRAGGAFFLTGVIFVLSVLGFVYLIEISRVASLGYALSTLRERQDQLAHEQSLLVYQLSLERTLSQVDRLARDQYGMRPFDIVTPETASGGTSRTKAPGAGASASPGRQFLTVRRPVPTQPTRSTPAATSRGLGERLWRQLAGVGVAGDAVP